ncbi:MAG: lipid asymmetry maintenance protein MlaB [Bdellovibrionales bacterium]
MGKEFKCYITGTDRLLVRLVGDLNEFADLRAAGLPSSPSVEVDLSELRTINSAGIREFLAWTSKIKNKDLSFSHCPKFFIDQVNMIAGLIPSQTKIVSFYVPFYCAELDKEKVAFYRSGLEFSVEQGIPQIRHPVMEETNHKYVLDVDERSFFKFLTKFG